MVRDPRAWPREGMPAPSPTHDCLPGPGFHHSWVAFWRWAKADLLPNSVQVDE